MEFEEDGLDFGAPIRTARDPESPGESRAARAIQRPADRPGFLRRGGEGAWHVFSALGFLLSRPSLWPLAVLPALVAAAGLLGGLLAGAFALRAAESALLPEPGKLAPAVALALTLTLWVSVLASGMLLGLALALLLGSPILDRLSRSVETVVRGSVSAVQKGAVWEITQTLRGSLRLLAITPAVVLVSLIPLVGPVVGLVWSGYVLALQQTDGPLMRRGFTARARKAWRRLHRAESLGFGITGLALVIVPVANCLLAPVLTVGGTLLVLDLEEAPG